MYYSSRRNGWPVLRRPAFFGVLMFMVVCSSAQTTLTFEGLKRTRLSYLTINLDKVELSSHADTLIWDVPNRAIDTLSLVAFRQNLVNLPQIQGATFSVDQILEDGAPKYHIHWEMVEAQTITPLFGFGGVKGNIHFLLGVNDQHLFGKGQELIAFYQNISGEHNFLFAYKNPSFRSTRFGVSAELRRYAAEEPVYFQAGQADYLYNNESISVGSSYMIRPRHLVEVGATIFNEDFELLEDSEAIAEAPVRFTVNKLLLKIGHRLDRRNYLSERISGSLNSTLAEVVINTNDEPFAIVFHEFRKFGLVGKRGNWASRLRLGIATNRESPFAPFVLDSELNIRGSGNRIDRGSAQAVLNLEYRHLVWSDKKKNFSVQTVGFSDIGSWRAPGGEFVQLTNGSTLRHFVGGGVRVISAKAKNAVLRLDYGVDVTNAEERGFVLGFGQYF